MSPTSNLLNLNFELCSASLILVAYLKLARSGCWKFNVLRFFRVSAISSISPAGKIDSGSQSHSKCTISLSNLMEKLEVARCSEK